MKKYRIITNGRAFKVQMRRYFIWFTVDEMFYNIHDAKRMIEHFHRQDEAKLVKWTVVEDKGKK